jgi:PBCV-specific basic adaptor domain
MKAISIAAFVFLNILPLSPSYADEFVHGYIRKDGTYVAPYMRSSPNQTNTDNYSTQGNVNPYTGSEGTRAPDFSPGALNYGGGSIIYTGPRGGQYYIDGSGNKVYVPKR